MTTTEKLGDVDGKTGDMTGDTVDMVRKYRKRPVVIEAIQWTGDNLKQVLDFTGKHPSVQDWDWEKLSALVNAEGLKIFTLEGTMMAGIGDFIIKGVQGEVYPCKPDIFSATYEVAE